ncbi:MAG: OmpA family protein [Erythrobacter sp.]
MIFIGFAGYYAFAIQAPLGALTCASGPYFVFFDHGRGFIGPEGRKVLDNAIDSVGHCGNSATFISGHTDTSESPLVADKRIQTVRSYLEARGIPRDDIQVQNFGHSELRIPTGDGVSEQQNRRVEVSFGPYSSLYERD